MFRIVLQRSAAQRRIAEQLEAVSLDEVLRRMQSSSLTNPARSLEAHFVLSTERCDHGSTMRAAAAAPSAEQLKETPGDLLRNALSERLLAEVRRDLDSPIITLDDGSLMLANCVRHGLSPLATQQIFALWQRCMDHAATGACYAALSRTSIAMLGRGKSSSALARPSGSAAGVSELTQFQSLVRVMEACLDAHDGQRRDFSLSVKETSLAAPCLRRIQTSSSIPLTLDDLAALVDFVEQRWSLFIDHGTSTTGLLVQFTALALTLTGCASSVAAEADAGSTFLTSLRRLSRLQTDRALLQQRIHALCERAIASLCSQEVEFAAAGDGGASPSRERPWWYQPQELVRLSWAMRLVEAYETERRQGSMSSSGTRLPVGHSRHGKGGGPRRPESSLGRDTRKDAGKAGLSFSSAARSTSPRRPHTASSAARWSRRVPTAWWSGSSTSAHGASAGHRKAEAALQAGPRLGAYVTRYAMQHIPKAKSRRSALPPSLPSYAISATLLSISLLDIEDVFATVCITASLLASTETARDFSWWMRDFVLQHHRQRGLDSVWELAGLIGIAEVCVVYPDGTQTVLAEALKCLELCAPMLWCTGDSEVTSGFGSPGLLWPRACQVVSDALPLSTVRAEAQRTLQALMYTASQTASSFTSTGESVSELARRHQRYGLLELACLQLQSPGNTITPATARVILQLVLAAPFRRDNADHGGLAAVARAMFVFTRPTLTLSAPASTPQDGLLYDSVVPYLLNELSRLLSSSAATSDDGATASVEDDRGKLQPLQQLTSAERQLLRSALQEVRLRTQCGRGEGPLWEPVLAPNSSQVDQRQATRTAPVQAPLSLSVTTPQVGVVGSAGASAPPFDREAGPMDANSGASQRCRRSHGRIPQQRMRVSEEHLLLQSEIDTLTRSLGQRRSLG
ncbi:hypothetical protein JKF63_07615 [Porcisia hertigi]|uniref:Uncharacterized protein n=1 Tax=Porcisia hertigi TaxID=2761500 RepID=A0A836IPI2_9TRYP|nr:hypothetical protein JKF63_07615 [Porcisia hertigi]